MRCKSLNRPRNDAKLVDFRRNSLRTLPASSPTCPFQQPAKHRRFAGSASPARGRSPDLAAASCTGWAACRGRRPPVTRATRWSATFRHTTRVEGAADTHPTTSIPAAYAAWPSTSWAPSTPGWTIARILRNPLVLHQAATGAPSPSGAIPPWPPMRSKQGAARLGSPARITKHAGQGPEARGGGCGRIPSRSLTGCSGPCQSCPATRG